MAKRKGVFVVPKDHPLQPSSVADEVRDTVQQVIERIRNIFHISEKALSFEIDQYSNSTSSIEHILLSVTGNQPDADEIRVMFSDKRVPDETVKKFLGQNALVVLVEEAQHSAKIGRLNGANGCRASIPTSIAVRFVEDIFIDIFIGRWMKDNSIFSALIKQQRGLPALFVPHQHL